MALERILAAVVKEFRQFFRDRLLLILVLWLYTAEVILCAVSLTFDLREEPIGFLDFDRTHESLQLADKLDLSPSFSIRFRPADEREARRLLEHGAVRLVAVVPAGFSERLARSEDPAVQLLLDGTHPVIARTALGEVERMLAPAAALSLLVDNRIRVWYNPTLQFHLFVVISMIALAAYMVGVIYPAASIVKEKESGTMEQLLVSPIRPSELILARALPTLIIGLVSLIPSILIARAFNVPLRGDFFALTVVSAVFLLSAIGTGVLIASLVRTLQQALLVAFFVLFPIMFLSGTVTPIESMPPLLQQLSRLSPLRYYLEALLAVFLKGVGVEVLASQILWMLALGGAFFAGSMIAFRRKVA